MNRWLILAFLVTGSSANAQKFGKNIPSFEYRKWHFGSMLGTNTTSYNAVMKSSVTNFDSIYHIQLNARPGLSIQIPVISYNPFATCHIRLVPSISFHETNFVYRYMKDGISRSKTYRTEPVNINAPLLFKLSAKRMNNFAPFALGGIGYSYNVSSQADVDQNLSDPVIKLRRSDFHYQIGGGFDFYLPYFKFGFELKTSRGINNLLIQDNTFFSAPLESLKSRVWWFSITFEG